MILGTSKNRQAKIFASSSFFISHVEEQIFFYAYCKYVIKSSWLFTYVSLLTVYVGHNVTYAYIIE